MVGSHAQIADVHRIEGVPYIVLPSSGKAPYGTPDRGGFTGWMDWTVDRSATASQQWLTADVRAFAQSATLDRLREALEAGDSTQLEGTIVQPSGVCPARASCRCATRCRSTGAARTNLALGTDVASREGRGQGRDPRPGHAQADRRCTSGDVTVTRDRRLDARVHRRGVAGADHDVEVIRTQVTHVDEDAPVGGTVPATLAADAGSGRQLRRVHAGRDQDLRGVHDGDRRLHGRRRDPDGLRARLPGQRRVQAGPAAAGLGLPKTYTGPVTNDVTTIGFKQEIAADDPLRTGILTLTR